MRGTSAEPEYLHTSVRCTPVQRYLGTLGRRCSLGCSILVYTEVLYPGAVRPEVRPTRSIFADHPGSLKLRMLRPVETKQQRPAPGAKPGAACQKPRPHRGEVAQPALGRWLRRPAEVGVTSARAASASGPGRGARPSRARQSGVRPSRGRWSGTRPSRGRWSGATPSRGGLFPWYGARPAGGCAGC